MSVTYLTVFGVCLLAGIIALSLLIPRKTTYEKRVLYSSLLATVLFVTGVLLFVSLKTVYAVSVPVAVWACGKQLPLATPLRIQNNFGATVTRLGGTILPRAMILPTKQGKAFISDGISCGDGNERVIQGFVITKTDQYKLIDIASYMPQSGECLIIEFDIEKSQTGKTCGDYSLPTIIQKKEIGS